MACKCRFSCKYTILPLSILIISLLQLYFQYSSIMTKRKQNLEEKDKRNQLYTMNFIFGKRYGFNLREIDDYFNYNALMKIPKLKELVKNGFTKWNEKREKKLNEKIYELFYLIIYDLIFIIFLYLYIFKSFKAGILKILIQILKCVFTAIRLKTKYSSIFINRMIYIHWENIDSRSLEFFDAEGFEIMEYLCNLVIILDIIWLIIIKRDARNNNNNLPETEFVIKKQVLTDENRVDYNEGGTIELKEEKIYSNDNNKESDEDKDDDNDEDKDDNNNINNDDENDNQNENEKDDEEINNNKYDEDNENINNNKDEDDDQENNCESNENNYNNYNNFQNSEVKNSFKENVEKEEDENNEEEEGIDENQETK